MGTENEAKFVLTLDGDGAPLRAVFAKFKREISNDVDDLEKLTSNVELFKGLTASLDKSAGAFDTAKANLAKLRDLEKEVIAAGENVGKDLATGIKEAAKAVASAEKDFTKQTAAVDRMRASLAAAGVNTKALGTEQIRLATALKQAEQAEAERQARQTLGIKSTRELTTELQKAGAALQLLRSSGTSSAVDLANAQKAYLEKQREVNAALAGNAKSADSVGTAIRSAFLGAVIPIVSVSAVVAAVTEGFRASVAAAKEWRLEIAKISTVTNGSQADIDALDEGVRKLARDMGFEAVEGARALYAILRSGVSKDNALAVLATSADVAKASLTDIGTAAKLSTALLKGYGVQVADLQRVLDELFQAQKDGGATIAELASGLGDLLPVARAAGVPIEEIAAAIRTMVRAGLDAPTAITSLQRVIAKLGNPEVIKNLQGVGIEVNGLVGTLTEIGKRNLSLDQLLGLGVGNEKSLKGIVALTSGYAELNGELGRLQQAAGATAKATALLDKTPQEAMERWNATLKEVGRNLGDEVIRGNFLLPILTSLGNAYNDAADRARKLREEFGLTDTRVPTTYEELARMLTAAGVAAGILTTKQHELNVELDTAKKAASDSAGALAQTVATMLTTVQGQAAATKQQIEVVTASLRLFADELAKQRDASQKLAAQAVADINARATAQIAGIDKATLGEQAAAEAVVAIQKKQAADRLAVIQQNAIDVQRALESEAAARRAIAGKSAEEQKQVENGIAQARLATLAQVKAALEAHYNELIGLARGHADKLKSIEEERVKVNASIEDQIRAIRRESLTAYQAYNDQIRQIDELTSKARQELAKGDQANLKAVDELANRARSLIGSIGKEVTDGSEVVVDAYGAQQTAIEKLGDVQKILNESLTRRAEAEKDAGTAAQESADKAKFALDNYRKAYDELVAKVGEGISIEINTDAESVTASLEKLQDAITQQKLLASVELDLKGAEAAIAALNEKIKSGAIDGAAELEASITGALERVAEKVPELRLDAEGAIEQVDNLGVKILALSALQPTVTATVESNVGEVQAAIDNLKQPTSSTHTIYVQRVEVNAAGGLVGEASRRLRNSPARDAVRRFASGGAVFRRPAWRKVPGSGNGDTVPAALAAGSFVMRKAAAQFYGDRAMSALSNGGGVQRFAGGGNVLAPGTIASRILLGPAGKGNLAGLSDEFRDVLDELFTLKERSQNMAQSSTGLNINEWAGRILNKFDSFDPNRKKRIKELVEESFEGWLLAIDRGRSAGVPVVMEAAIAALAFLWGGRASAGGTDTVPAMLTPGEWVINRSAVSRYGADLMHAINAMAVPRETLSGMLTRPATPARFAEGGPVGGASFEFAPGASPPVPGATIDRGIIVNLNASAADLFSQDNVRRFLIPVLDEIDRRRDR